MTRPYTVTELVVRRNKRAAKIRIQKGKQHLTFLDKDKASNAGKKGMESRWKNKEKKLDHKIK